ncbi:MAG: hypothetical protein E6J43_00480, partial [Chloroflexi bacterium]
MNRNHLRPARVRLLLLLALATAFVAWFSFTTFMSSAVQNPTISLDMVTTGTTYNDTTNTMTVGAIDSSSTSS